MGRKLYAEGQGFNPTTGIDDVEGLREELDALKGSGGGGGDTTAIERRLTTAEGEIDDLQRDVAEQSEEVAAVGAKVNTLQGTDAGKSVRTIAAEETAKIVGGAPDNYDTLKEIADYISSDAEGAAELRNKVNKNATDIATLQSTKASKTEAQGYATTAKNEAIAAAASDAQTKANTAESNANDYTDGAVDGLAKGQVAINKTNIAIHTQQIANLDSDKLGKTEKAADSAKLGGVAAADYMQKSGGTFSGEVTHIKNIILYSGTSADNLRVLKFSKGGGNQSAGEILFQAGGGQNGLRIASVYGAYASRQDLVIYTSNNVISPYEPIWESSLVVKHTGSVGIGTTAPTEKLEVNGNAKAEKFIGELQGNADSSMYILTQRQDNDSFYTSAYKAYIKWLTSKIATMKLTDGDFLFQSDLATKLATPRTIWGQSFDGSGNVRGDILLLNKDSSDGNASSALIEFSGGLRYYGPYIKAESSPTNGGYGRKDLKVYQRKATVWPSDYSNHFVAMIIDAIGNVGIGTINPTEKLEVAGNIKASGVLTTGSDAKVGGAIDVEGGITSRGDIDASAHNIKGNLSGTIDRVANSGDNATPIHILGLPTEGNNKPHIDTGVTVEGGVISAEGVEAETIEAATLEGNLDGTIKATMRDTNLVLLGFAQGTSAGTAAKPYVTTQVSVNNGVLTIKGLRVEGDVEITGNTVIGGRVTSAASYQSSPISTTSEEDVPTTEEQLRAQISALEERIATLEQLIAQNNG